jgi:hypothetical protein
MAAPVAGEEQMNLDPIDPDDARLTEYERQVIRNAAYRIHGLALQAIMRTDGVRAVKPEGAAVHSHPAATRECG